MLLIFLCIFLRRTSSIIIKLLKLWVWSDSKGQPLLTATWKWEEFLETTSFAFCSGITFFYKSTKGIFYLHGVRNSPETSPNMVHGQASRIMAVSKRGLLYRPPGDRTGWALCASPGDQTGTQSPIYNVCFPHI